MDDNAWSPDDTICNAAKRFTNVKSLQKEQIIAIKSIIYGKRDTMVLLPTGYGKSLIYQLLPEVHKLRNDRRAVVLVVSPLNAIMEEQVRELRDLGIKAAILGEDEGTSSGILDASITRGEVEIVFGSAEKWLSKKWRHELQNGYLGKHVSEIAVDEAHTVLEW